MKTNNWIIQFDKNFCQREFNPTGEYSYLIIAYNERNPEKFKDFITKTLQQQREDLIGKIEKKKISTQEISEIREQGFFQDAESAEGYNETIDEIINLIQKM